MSFPPVVKASTWGALSNPIPLVVGLSNHGWIQTIQDTLIL